MKKDDKLSSYQAKQDLIHSRSEIAKRDNKKVLIASVAAVVSSSISTLAQVLSPPSKTF
jgi:hypothetical protein